MSWWLVLILSGAVFGLAAELGHRIGRKQPGDVVEIRKGHSGILLTALLALLGLLLAFSFNIVESRFSARKALVLEEANAISTAYLRAEMLPKNHEERVAELLRKYVAIRLSPSTAEELQSAIARSEELHWELWSEAVAVAEAHPESHVVALFVQSLNEVFDLHSSRVAVGFYQRLPRAILALLYVVAVLAMGVIGFNSGLTRWRSPLATAALILSVASVIVLIVEFDRPGGRLVHVNQRAMEDVRETIDARRAWPESRVQPHGAVKKKMSSRGSRRFRRPESD